jgi:hypothetical protein
MAYVGADELIPQDKTERALVITAVIILITFVGIKTATDRISTVELLLASVPLLSYATVKFIRSERESRVLSQQIPFILIYASALAKTKTTEQIIKELAFQGGIGAENFRKAHNMIEQGICTHDVLKRMKNESGNKDFNLVWELLAMHERMGKAASSLLYHAAKLMGKLEHAKRERAMLTAVQQLSVLGTVGIFLPVTLGLIVALVSNVHANIYIIKEGSVPPATAFARFYMLEICVLSSIFLGLARQSWKHAIAAALALSLISQLTFEFALMMSPAFR